MIKKCVTVLAAAAVLAACGNGTTDPRVPTALQADHQAVTVETWDTARVDVIVVDQTGDLYPSPPDHTINWTTSNAQIATVSDGLIRGIGVGSATIRAEATGLEPAEIQVTVDARTVTAQIGFEYSDHRTGTFELDVTYRLDQIDWDGNWGFTSFNGLFDDQDLEGQRLRSDGKLDYLLIWIDGAVTQTGDYGIGAYLAYGFDPANGSYESQYLGGGSVSIATVSARDLTGTFDLDMVEGTFIAGDFQPTGEELTITLGTFSLPVVTAPDFSNESSLQAHPVAGQVAEPRPAPLRERLRLPR